MRIAILAGLVLLWGCASSLDQTREIKDFQYINGVTTRSEVINALGLPDTSVVDDAKGVHILGYMGKADGSDLFIPLPVSSTYVGNDMYLVQALDVGGNRTAELQEMDVIFIFDKSNILINIRKPADIMNRNSQEELSLPRPQ